MRFVENTINIKMDCALFNNINNKKNAATSILDIYYKIIYDYKKSKLSVMEARLTSVAGPFGKCGPGKGKTAEGTVFCRENCFLGCKRIFCRLSPKGGVLSCICFYKNKNGVMMDHGSFLIKRRENCFCVCQYFLGTRAPAYRDWTCADHERNL